MENNLDHAAYLRFRANNICVKNVRLIDDQEIIRTIYNQADNSKSWVTLDGIPSNDFLSDLTVKGYTVEFNKLEDNNVNTTIRW